MVEVIDKAAAEAAPGKKAARERGDPNVVGSVSAPMSGDVLEVKIKPGAFPVILPATSDGSGIMWSWKL